MKKLQKFKKDVKGFTLVEIIVVLLIIAILAAIAIPTMIGYVDEAKESEYIAQARTAYVAAQTVAIKETAKDPEFKGSGIVLGKDAKAKGSILRYLGTKTKVTSITVADGDMNKEAITKATVGVAKTAGGAEAYTVVFADGQEPVVKNK
ncbi:MAG: prepilin-type N-terminal cleavage/methylation domain-containing protein [Erysipelotrichaceae bacterium]